jgi:hypothetical protein
LERVVAKGYVLIIQNCNLTSRECVVVAVAREARRAPRSGNDDETTLIFSERKRKKRE